MRSFECVNGVKLPCAIAPRRPGDVVACWADAGKATRLLGWEAQKTLDEMCRDSWNWTKKSLR